MGRLATPLYLELIKTAPGASLERERLKLDRLRELRATIDALRGEPCDSDPLLQWVLHAQAERERGHHPLTTGGGNKSD